MPYETEEARETLRGIQADLKQAKQDQAELDEELAERRRQRAAQEWAEAGGDSSSRENPSDYLEEPTQQEREVAESAEEEAQREAARSWAAAAEDK